MIVNPFSVGHGEADAAMAAPLAKAGQGGYLQRHGIIFAVEHGMEGNAVVNAGPVLGLAAAPGGKFTPAGRTPGKDEGAQGGWIVFRTGGTEEGTVKVRIVPGFLVIFPHLHHLIVDIHFKGILKRRCGLGGGVDIRHGSIVEKGIPGIFIHIAGGFQAIVLLEFFHGTLGIGIITGGGFVEGEKAKVHQPLLHLLHIAALIAIGQFPNKGLIGAGGGCRGRLCSFGNRGGRGPHRQGKEKFLAGHIRIACHFQAVFPLEGFHGRDGAFQEIAAAFAPVIAQLRQLFLHQLHIQAAVPLRKRAIAGAVNDGQGGIIRQACFLQPIGMLHRSNGVFCCFGIFFRRRHCRVI